MMPILTRPTSNSPLIVFRVLFGMLMFLHSLFAITDGAVYRNFIEPPFTFSFIGFEFLQPLPGYGMYYYFGIMGILSLMLMAGAWFRLSSILLAVMWTAVYLMQKVDYNNHYYLMVLLCWMMCITPAHKRFSIDVLRKIVKKETTMQQWVVLMFIFQVALMYFFAGISKCHPDWLSGRFIGIMFSRWAKHPHLGHVYGNETFQHFISYAGLVFDLLIVPLLLWEKTRRYAFMIAIGFHLFNSYTFRIGIFPYLGIALCIFFFPGNVINGIFFLDRNTTEGKSGTESKHIVPTKWLTLLFFAYFTIQLVLPIRHLFFPGDVYWTDEGYRMSWKMMMRTKSGTIQFRVYDNTSGETWMVNPLDELSSTHVMWLAGSPDMIWQYAQKIKNDCSKKRHGKVSVYAISSVSLNRWPARPLVDPETDLANVTWNPFRHSAWILPFEQ